MFDHIGVEADPNTGKRRLQSLLWTSGVLASVAGAALYATLQIVEAHPLVPDDVPIEFVQLDDEPQDPMQAPAPPLIAKGDPEAPADPPPVAVEEPLTEPEDTIRKPAPNRGSEEGTGDSDEGTETGVPGGTTGGTGIGPGNGMHRISATELKILKQYKPVYPRAAKSADYGPQSCLVTVFMDERGKPYDVTVAACPEVFHMPTKQAIFRWRWVPPRIGKQRVKAQTSIRVTYQLQ